MSARPASAETGAGAGEQPEITGFTLVLNNFEGPFDLLLSLINSKKLDVTEVAASDHQHVRGCARHGSSSPSSS